MKIVSVVIALMLLSGCSITQRYKEAYRLQTNHSFTPQNAELCRDKTIKVSQSFSKSTLMTREMRYIEGEYNEYIFSESEWSQSPNSAITQEITQSLRSWGIFGSVQGYRSRSKSDYILESSVEDFMQYFSRDLKSSFVNVVIHFTLVNAADSQVLKSFTFSKKIDVATVDAKGGVVALNQALSEILHEKNIWLSEVCR